MGYKGKVTFDDLFAGGGGTSTGAFGVENLHVSWALNHDAVAIATHEANHPETKRLITLERQYISKYYNGIQKNGNKQDHASSIENPLAAITTQEKFQFITTYFNSSGNPGSQNQSLDKPLNTILTATNKKALVIAIKEGQIDFDIKMRFLTSDELSSIMGFPKGYFKKNKLNNKQIFKMIGNSVPIDIAKAIIEPIKEEIIKFQNA